MQSKRFALITKFFKIKKSQNAPTISFKKTDHIAGKQIVEYKAQAKGIEIVCMNLAYTSQTYS